MIVNPFTGAEVFAFNSILNVRFGRGALAEATSELKSWGKRRVFAVIDPGVEKAGLAQPLLDDLAKAQFTVEVTTDVDPNPRDVAIEAAAARAKSFGAEAVIGLGGGSAMDSAKMVACLCTNPGTVADYDGTGKVQNDAIPGIAIPTTAGTGSEVTGNAAVTHTATHYKMSVRSPRNLPKLAILDPNLLRTLPPSLAAHSGLDAMTHALEGFMSVRATELSDLMALEALRKLAANIRPFCANPANLEAGGNMLMGSMLAGLVISNAGTGACHALARALGGKFDMAHGLTTALFMPRVLAFNAAARPERYGAVARAFGIDDGGMPEAVAQRVVDWFLRLLDDLGVPSRLRDIGVGREALAELVPIAAKNIGPNPRRSSDKDLMALFEAAY